MYIHISIEEDYCPNVIHIFIHRHTHSLSLSHTHSHTHQVLDPLVGLTLRVNKQGPPPGILYHHSVLHRQCVLGQPGNLPPPDQHWFSQGRYEGGRAVVWYTVL